MSILVGHDGLVGGLVFDEVDVDPQTGLLITFQEWATTLSATKSPTTLTGYLSDAALFGGAMLEVVGKSALPDTTGTLPGAGSNVPGRPSERLFWSGASSTPPASYWRAERVVATLVLSDLHPHNCAKALEMLGSERTPVTLARIASAWSSLCGLAVRRGLLATNPMSHVDRGPVARVPRKKTVLSESEIDSVLSAARSSTAATGRRDGSGPSFAVAALLLTAAPGVSELCGSCVGDVRTSGPSPRLEILGQGTRRRSIPLCEPTATAIRSYLTERTAGGAKVNGSDPLFARPDGTRFTPRAIRRLVSSWFASAGVTEPRGGGVRAMQDTFAAAALDSGTSLTRLQEILGHASVDTTRGHLVSRGRRRCHDARSGPASERGVRRPTEGDAGEHTWGNESVTTALVRAHLELDPSQASAGE